MTEPLGFWDPLGFCSADDITEGKIKFYREVELKHGRVGMLAALGFVVGENFHPLFGGNIDAPAYLAFQQTPLETFWPLVVIAIAIPEIYSVFTFETVGANDSRGNPTPQGQPWAIRADHESGDLGFDPLGLKPTDATEFARADDPTQILAERSKITFDDSDDEYQEVGAAANGSDGSSDGRRAEPGGAAQTRSSRDESRPLCSICEGIVGNPSSRSARDLCSVLSSEKVRAVQRVPADDEQSERFAGVWAGMAITEPMNGM